jgi:hypothetical protein
MMREKTGMVKGRRIDADPSEDKDQYPFPKLMPGDYGKDLDGVWHGVPPNFLDAFHGTANLEKHKVIEHEDGTITVWPSILIRTYLGEWHGFLERGVWRTA